MATTTYDKMSRRPKKVEMRLNIVPGGDHETELRDTDPSGKMNKIVALRYKRPKS